MTYSKLSLLFNAVLAFTFVGCGSDDSGDSNDDGSSGGSTNSNGGSGGTSAGGTGGSAAGGTGGSTAGGTGGSTAGGTGGSTAGGTGGGTTGGGGVNACNPLEGDPSEECTAYRDCGLSACESEYEECLGSNAASGDYSGSVCEDFFECLGDCQSGDQCDIFCVADCAEGNDACQTCLEATDECGSEACPDEADTCDASRPTTTTGSTTGGGVTGTCMDFEECCNSLEGEDQTGCFETLEQVAEGGDQACGVLLAVYQAGGQCPS